MSTHEATRRALVVASLLVVVLLNSGCGRSDEVQHAEHSAAAAPAGATAAAPADASTEAAVARRAKPTPDAAPATYAQIVGELGVDVDPDIPPDEIEDLFLLFRNSLHRMRSVRRVGPDIYRVRSWSSIPHGARETLYRRVGPGWELVVTRSWVLIGDA